MRAVLKLGMLRRLWRVPPEPHPFRPLAALTDYWSEETLALADRWLDAALVREGLDLFRSLSRSAPVQVLLATDLHAGNVLRATLSRSLEIPHTTPRSTCSTVKRGCGAIRPEPSGVSRICSNSTTSAFVCARVAAAPRSRWSERSIDLARALAR